jgi:hypothetical protein
VTIALAHIQTDEEEAEDDADKDENAEDDSAEKPSEGELSTTIRSEVIGRKSHKWRNFMLLLLLLIIAAGIYIWMTKDTNPTSQSIVAAITPYWEKLCSYIK